MTFESFPQNNFHFQVEEEELQCFVSFYPKIPNLVAARNQETTSSLMGDTLIITGKEEEHKYVCNKCASIRR